MNAAQIEYLNKLISDSLNLKGRGQLTEHGEGQLLVAQTILKLQERHNPDTCPGCIESKDAP